MQQVSSIEESKLNVKQGVLSSILDGDVPLSSWEPDAVRNFHTPGVVSVI